MTMSGDAATLPDLLAQMWRARLYVLAGLVLGCGIFGVFCLVVTPRYEASMIVAPLSLSGAQDQFAQLGFDPVKAGMPLGARNNLERDGTFVHFEQILRGTANAEKIRAQNELLRGIANDPSYRGDDMAADVSEYFQCKVRITPIGASASRKITYRHPDPEFAVRLLTALHKTADETLRGKAKGEREARILWLQEELKNTFNPDHRAALAALLLAEERGRMLASMEGPFAAEIVEPPASSSRPVFPNPLLVVPAGGFAGMLIGFLVFSLRRKERFDTE
jgi:uncharacterized protein involved in exopolysaccharide biosynthesis